MTNDKTPLSEYSDGDLIMELFARNTTAIVVIRADDVAEHRRDEFIRNRRDIAESMHKLCLTLVEALGYEPDDE